MPPPSPQQRRIVRRLALVLSAGAAATTLTVLVLADQAETAVGLGVLLVPAVAVAYLPLALPDDWFRIATAVVGAALVLGGLVLLNAGIGLLIIAIGLLYVGVALAPARWGAWLTMTLGLLLGAAALYGALVLAYLLADLFIDF